MVGYNRWRDCGQAALLTYMAASAAGHQVLQDTAMRWRVGNADAGGDLENTAPIHFKGMLSC